MPVGTLVKSLVTLFVFLFKIFVGTKLLLLLLFLECVRLPFFWSLRSPLLAALWCFPFWRFLLECVCGGGGGGGGKYTIVKFVENIK